MKICETHHERFHRKGERYAQKYGLVLVVRDQSALSGSVRQRAGEKQGNCPTRPSVRPNRCGAFCRARRSVLSLSRPISTGIASTTRGISSTGHRSEERRVGMLLRVLW